MVVVQDKITMAVRQQSLARIVRREDTRFVRSDAALAIVSSDVTPAIVTVVELDALGVMAKVSSVNIRMGIRLDEIRRLIPISLRFLTMRTLRMRLFFYLKSYSPTRLDTFLKSIRALSSEYTDVASNNSQEYRLMSS